MIERWILFYDGACPLCLRTQSKLPALLPNVRLTALDLNSKIAESKGYKDQVVLETEHGIYKGLNAWIKILSQTKYRFITFVFFRPILIIGYFFISKNRKLISKLIKI
jgi:predicted DCC family thiol-disulfide oxidoreductase YuxK